MRHEFLYLIWATFFIVSLPLTALGEASGEGRAHEQSKLERLHALADEGDREAQFRLGEIYMNAAEAAFELGQTGEALEYVNALRERAGFPPNSLSTLDRDKIRSERWAELAFEGHRFWDVKRWRIAHLLWDGNNASRTANIYSLWGYRVVGGPNDGKYVYDKKPSERQGQPRFWRLGNYYSEIPGGVRGNNPNLVANPFH